MAVADKTCERLEVEEGGVASRKKVIFVKGTWFPAHFDLAVSDGLVAWTFDGSEKFVEDQADECNKSVRWLMERMQLYLSQQQPDSLYSFTSIGDDKMLIFEIHEKDECILQVDLPLQWAPDAETITQGLLEFLLKANFELKNDVVQNSLELDHKKKQAQDFLAQSEQFKNDKVQYEQDFYKKVVAVLKTKKQKLRELRDQLTREAASNPAAKASEDEADLGEDTESLDEDESDIENERANV